MIGFGFWTKYHIRYQCCKYQARVSIGSEIWHLSVGRFILENYWPYDAATLLDVHFFIDVLNSLLLNRRLLKGLWHIAEPTPIQKILVCIATVWIF